MGAKSRWTVDVQVTQDDEERVTHAEATLRLPDGKERRGSGYARRNPIDARMPQIGDELAVARALSDLAHELLHTAVSDIQTATHEKVTLGS